MALHGDTRAIRKHGRAGNWKMAYETLMTGADPVPDAESAWKILAKHEIRLIFRDDPDFPPLLREIDPAPLALYVRGDLVCSSSSSGGGGGGSGCDSGSGGVHGTHGARAVAIVGTRRATPDGKRLAEQFARELSRMGLTIVSGLALGIDAAAHEGALDARGTCIAVLANGLDRIYPETNRRLAEKIVSGGGAIISEYPPYEPPLKYRFLERNRIVSGIAHGTLVIEAPESSGSLATAGFALAQNRDVFVVPGPITHPNFRGAHSLIRQGAELVTSADDILAAYGIEKTRGTAMNAAASSPEETLILAALAGASRALDVDKIIATTKLEPRIVNQALTFLLLRKVVRETGGQYTI
jgi:DNA processing protein